MSIASKNFYDLLDPEPAQPVTVTAKAKPSTAPRSANEQAFRDRKAGSQANRDRDTNPTDGESRRGRGGRGAARGGRGARPPRTDRQDTTGRTDNEKPVGRGWGGKTGNDEWKDEQAGEKLAKVDAENSSPEGFNADSGEEKEQQPKEEEEPAPVSYATWLEQKSSQQGFTQLPPREVESNVKGTKIESKKTASEDAENVDVSQGRRSTGRRKVIVDIDTRSTETAPRPRPEGRSEGRFEGRGEARGEGRGGRGRGGPRGGRGARGDRGDREARPEREPRADRDAAPRADTRGRSTRALTQTRLNVDDSVAFPSLGF